MTDIQTSSQPRKLKVCLTDFDSNKDIEVRLFLSHLTPRDLEIFEEILLGSVTIPIHTLSADLGLSFIQMREALEKLSESLLFTIKDDTIYVDKERRKYFELNLLRFEEGFKPDLEFFRGLLRHVPIHVLPIWYLLPRNVSDIFDALVEKYFMTPTVYERHLKTAPFENPLLAEVAKKLESSNSKLDAQSLCDDFGLDARGLQELALLSELSLVAYLAYEKKGDSFTPVFLPLKEYSDYQKCKERFSPSTSNKEAQTKDIFQMRPIEFAFVKDMSKILELTKTESLEVDDHQNLSEESIQIISRSLEKMPPLSKDNLSEQTAYFKHLLHNLLALDILSIKDGQLISSSAEPRWIELSLEDQGFCLLSRFRAERIKKCASNEKSAREAEKAISQAIDHNWISFENFMKGAIIPFRPEIDVCITKTGKRWTFALPTYEEEEVALMKTTLFEGLFEAGIVEIGLDINAKEMCFKVTAFGEAMFGS